MSSSHNQAMVVTTPPWAEDEPPTPRTSLSGHPDHQTNERQLSDNTSTNNSVDTRWWSFTRPHTTNTVLGNHAQHAPSLKSSQHRTMSWLASPPTLKDIAAFARRDKLGDDAQNVQTSPAAEPSGYNNALTSSLESPWVPQAPGLGLHHNLSEENLGDGAHLQIKRKRFRDFALINPYAPLLFRFINISLTSSALGIAVRIRRTELQNNILGAVGSSSMVVIIFAPLTLIHVLVAIYLDYFGRPVGLWATSAKLAYTLLETLFICACIYWFSHIPRPSSHFSEQSIDDRICDDQVALICLVGFSLLTYCINLIISLFRIFEKVKYHSITLFYLIHFVPYGRLHNRLLASSMMFIQYVQGKVRTFITATLTRDFLSGIVILLIVVFLWTASNFLTQNIYNDGYEKPFLVTYLSTSSFVLYLFPYCAHQWWRAGDHSEQDDLRQEPEFQPLNTTADPDDIIDEEHATSVIARGSSSKAVLPPLTTKQTANLAMAFCVLWFIANWSLNASLNYTTAASAMILSSTSGFFTLGIGRILRVEALTRIKMLAVVTSFSGVVLVYVSDSHQKQPAPSIKANESYHPLLGDFLGLISALFYAFYVILLKIRIGSESRIDMRLFFGFVGLLNILFAWPVAVLLHVIGIEILEWPSTRSAVIAILINMGITLSSDYLYVKAMLKTTPLVVTVGLSLTIPFAVVGDIILGHTIHMQVIMGAMLVMFSFVAVGIDGSSERAVED